LFSSTFLYHTLKEVYLLEHILAPIKRRLSILKKVKKCFKIRKDADAEKLIKKAIEEDPQFIEAHSAYADFLMGNNRIKEAIPLYEKAIQLNPKIYVDNNYYLGGAYMSVGEYEKAIPCFDKIIKTERINPNLKDEAARFYKKRSIWSKCH
jgi:tetratricopeptide (TPR) repeat protein